MVLCLEKKVSARVLSEEEKERKGILFLFLHTVKLAAVVNLVAHGQAHCNVILGIQGL